MVMGLVRGRPFLELVQGLQSQFEVSSSQHVHRMLVQRSWSNQAGFFEVIDAVLNAGFVPATPVATTVMVATGTGTAATPAVSVPVPAPRAAPELRRGAVSPAGASRPRHDTAPPPAEESAGPGQRQSKRSAPV